MASDEERNERAVTSARPLEGPTPPHPTTITITTTHPLSGVGVFMAPQPLSLRPLHNELRSGQQQWQGDVTQRLESGG